MGSRRPMEAHEEDLKTTIRWKPRRRSFILQRLRKSFCKENLPPPSEPVTITGDEDKEVPGRVSDAANISLPASNSSSIIPGKRKTATSPVVTKKYLRRVSLPFVPHVPTRLSASHGVEHQASLPSAFEQELLSGEDQSPNNPDFIRRASQRWKSKTVLSSSHPKPLHVLECADFCQWPKCPGQQPVFQQQMSSKSVQYLDSQPCIGVRISTPMSSSTKSYVCLMSPQEYPSSLNNSSIQNSHVVHHSSTKGQHTSSCQEKKSFLWCTNRRPSVTAKPHHQKYLTTRSSMTLSRDHNSLKEIKETVNSGLSFPVQRRFSLADLVSTRIQGQAYNRLDLDDSGTEEVRRAKAHREMWAVCGRKEEVSLDKDEKTVSGKQPRSLTGLPFRRFSQRLCKSFRKRVCESSLQHFAVCSGACPPSHLYISSCPSSTSYQNSLASTSSRYYDVLPSSTSSTRSRCFLKSSLKASVTLPSLATSGGLSFKDIFVSEPQIAEKCVCIYVLS